MRLARDFRPEVAFIDLHMPRMGGIELAAALKAEPWAADLRLIALTGMGGATDINRTLTAGFEAHLTKPASPQEVLRLAASQASNIVELFANRERG